MALRYHPTVLVAVAVAATLVALAASSSPFVTTAVASEALRNKLDELTPLSTGLQIQFPGLAANVPPSVGRQLQASHARDAVIGKLAARLPHVGAPIYTAETAGNDLNIFEPAGDQAIRMLARPGAVAHVKKLSEVSGPGVWISNITAETAKLEAGDTFRLDSDSKHPLRYRVKGVYRALAQSPVTPYWTNFFEDAWPQTLDASPPTPYVFVSRPQLYRAAASQQGTDVQQRAELPVDPKGITLPQARDLDRRFTAVRDATRSAFGSKLGCIRTFGGGHSCTVQTSLSSAVALADQNVSAIQPVVTLLADIAAAIALGVAAAAGVFLVRRRSAESSLLYARGESPATFTGRTFVEVLLPTLAGGLLGFGLAYGLTSVFTPRGALSSATVWSGAAHAAVGVAIGALAAAGRRRLQLRAPLRHGHACAAVLGALPLVGGARSGGSGVSLRRPAKRRRALREWPDGLSSSDAGGVPLPAADRRGAGGAGSAPRPRTAAVAAAGARTRCGRVPRAAAAGCRARVARRAHGGLGRRVRCLVLRRRALELAHAHHDGEGLHRERQRRAGCDPADRARPDQVPYPVTKVQFANQGIFIDDESTPANLMAVDPSTLASTLHWQGDWGPNPAGLVRKLGAAPSRPLPVITTKDAAGMHTLLISEVPFPVRVVGTVNTFPGTEAGVPLVITPFNALASEGGAPPPARSARRAVHLPLGEGPSGFGCACPVGLGGTSLLRDDGRHVSARPGRRAGDAHLCLHAHRRDRVGRARADRVLLYLQARQRSQVIASAITRRMGLRQSTETLSLCLELAAILFFAAIVGGAVAIAAASPIVRHLDPLPLDPPAPIFVFPVLVVLIAAVGLALFTIVASAITSWLARRTDVSEAIRVV